MFRHITDDLGIFLMNLTKNKSKVNIAMLFKGRNLIISIFLGSHLDNVFFEGAILIIFCLREKF